MLTAAGADWMAVPARIRDLYIKHAGDARDIMTGKREIPLIVTECGPVVLYKEAGGALTAGGSLFGAANRTLGIPFGHPNALTTALLTGALTAGTGYGLGWLAEKLFPEKYMRRGPLKRNLAIAGGLLGGLGGGYAYGKPLVEDYGLKGLLMQAPAPLNKGASSFSCEKEGRYQEAVEQATEEFGIEFENDALYEKAANNIAGLVLPSIPKDDFNQMVLNDPYTPMMIRAGTLGLTEAASQSRGGIAMISPLDIARIAVGMGAGAVSGTLVGRTLGALAGLTPAAQEGLQRAGIMAGLLTNIIPKAFGQ